MYPQVEVKVEVESSDNDYDNYNEQDIGPVGIEPVNNDPLKQVNNEVNNSETEYDSQFKVEVEEHDIKLEPCSLESSTISEDVLKKNLQPHITQTRYQCSSCDKCFSNQNGLLNHQIIHNEEKPYHCTHCDSFFAQKAELIEHHRDHTGKKLYQCNKCYKYFVRECVLIKHQRIQCGKRSCNYCGKTFDYISMLERHKLMHTKIRSYKCGYCDKSFVYRHGLKNHQMQADNTCANTKPLAELCGYKIL